MGEYERMVGVVDDAKINMTSGWVFDNFDLALILHSSNSESLVRYRSLTMVGIEFNFRGHTPHAATSPWEGRNVFNGSQVVFTCHRHAAPA